MSGPLSSSADPASTSTPLSGAIPANAAQDASASPVICESILRLPNYRSSQLYKYHPYSMQKRPTRFHPTQTSYCLDEYIQASHIIASLSDVPLLPTVEITREDLLSLAQALSSTDSDTVSTVGTLSVADLVIDLALRVQHREDGVRARGDLDSRTSDH